MNFLLALAIVSLFLPLKIETTIVHLRPFDGIVVFLSFMLLLRIRETLREPIPTGFFLLLPFFSLHIFSAYTYGFSNGLRESLQIGLVTLFALTIGLNSRHLDYPKIINLIVVGLVLITVYSVVWHIDQGLWSGWKRLDDPKKAFTFLPMIVACLIATSISSKKTGLYISWAILGLVVLFSGERKAILVFGLLTGALVARGRWLVAIPVVALGLSVLMYYASVTDNVYLSSQIKATFNPVETSATLLDLQAGIMPASLSNAQRMFAVEQAFEMFWEAPFLGVGTNAYEEIVKERFSYLPRFMLSGIHGEFVRILAENGIVGFVAYSFVWVCGYVRFSRVLGNLISAGFITSVQGRLLPIVVLMPPLFFVAFEASGTDSLIVLILVSLMPELFAAGKVLQNLRELNEERSGRYSDAEATV